MNKDEMLSGPGGPSVVRGPSLKTGTTGGAAAPDDGQRTARQCPKCRAGAVYLEARVEHLAAGVTLQTVRCVRCGWRVSRPVSARQMAARRDTSARLKNVITLGPCAVEGCPGTVAVERNKTGLCVSCAGRLASWRKGRRTTPAPIIERQGRWQVNPASRAFKGGAP